MIQPAEFVKPAPPSSDYFELRSPAEEIDAGFDLGKLGVRRHFLSFLLWRGIHESHTFTCLSKNPDLLYPQNPPLCALHDSN